MPDPRCASGGMVREAREFAAAPDPPPPKREYVIRQLWEVGKLVDAKGVTIHSNGTVDRTNE